MTGQIAILASANAGKIEGKFLRVSYSCSKTGQEKIRFGMVINCGNGPKGYNITIDTSEGVRTLPLKNMENSAKFITENEFRNMFPNWKPYQPK